MLQYHKPKFLKESKVKYSVKNPIPGFENIKEVEITKIDDFFVKMQDVDSKTSFTMINPYALRPDYEFDIPTPYKNLLEIDENSKLELYAIVAISSPIEESTVNFLAPVLCNTTSATLAQIVLDNRYYPNFGQAEKISNYVQKQ